MFNVGKPGSYSEELNATLRFNNLPEIKIPHEPPSKEILGAFAGAECISRPKENEMDTENEQNEQGKENGQAEEGPNTTVDVIKGQDINLRILTPRSRGWPKGELTNKGLIRGIQDRKYKYTYTDEKVEEEDIIRSISTNKIDLKDCFSIVEDSLFNKVRSGRIAERTPPARHSQKLARKSSM